MAVFRVGDDQSGDEGTQRHRETEVGSGEGRAQAEQNDAQDKGFAFLQSGHLTEQPGNHEAGESAGYGHEEECFAGEQENVGDTAAGAAQVGSDEHQGHDAEVLEDEDAERGTTVDGIQVASVFQEPNYQGGARQ